MAGPMVSTGFYRFSKGASKLRVSREDLGTSKLACLSLVGWDFTEAAEAATEVSDDLVVCACSGSVGNGVFSLALR